MMCEDFRVFLQSFEANSGIFHISPQPLPSTVITKQYIQIIVQFDAITCELLTALQTVQDDVQCPCKLVHDISYRMKKFAARILISSQFPSNHTFQCISSAPGHSGTN